MSVSDALKVFNFLSMGLEPLCDNPALKSA
jgi:hypothetical protein